jgi:hypothetical protein
VTLRARLLAAVAMVRDLAFDLAVVADDFLPSELVDPEIDCDLAEAAIPVSLAVSLLCAVPRCIGCGQEAHVCAFAVEGADGASGATRIDTWCETIGCEKLTESVIFAEPVTMADAAVVARLRRVAFGGWV